jgi:hypothetical protein
VATTSKVRCDKDFRAAAGRKLALLLLNQPHRFNGPKRHFGFKLLNSNRGRDEETAFWKQPQLLCAHRVPSAGLTPASVRANHRPMSNAGSTLTKWQQSGREKSRTHRKREALHRTVVLCKKMPPMRRNTAPLTVLIHLHATQNAGSFKSAGCARHEWNPGPLDL